MTHLIGQEHLEVELMGSEAQALLLQRTLPSLCRHWLTPAIERALEAAEPASGHLYVERLEIDLGSMALERLEHDLADSVARELEKALRELSAPGGKGVAASGEVRRKTERECSAEALVHFLATGRLPWSFRLPEGGTLEQALTLSREKEGGPVLPGPAARSALMQALASPVSRARLLRQFSPPFLKILLSDLSPQVERNLEQVFLESRSPELPSPFRETLERRLWEAAFAELAAGGQPTARQLAEKGWEALPEEAQVEPVLGALERSFPGVTARSRGRGGSFGAGKTPERVPETAPGGKPSQKGREASVGAAAEEGIYLDNAGLVLLHPFLPQLFGALGISREESLLKPERALPLLHFLATGEESAPEYRLMLPKLLCNLSLDQAVEREGKPSAAEREEGTALLEAVIRHWGALGNCSPDALRGTFLLRGGKLSPRQGDWLLQVEPESCDILLDRLPWGISMIKLPWMTRLLWVEWG